jgi:methionyl-tRNA synthetase
LAKTYGTDPVRFYLTYIMPESADADFAWEDFVSFNNNVLINTYGNFINRVLKLSESVDFAQLKVETESGVQSEVAATEQAVTKHLDNCEFKLYAQSLINLARFGNEYIAKNEPWKLAKSDREAYRQVMGNAMQIVLALMSAMKPLIPESAKRLENLLGLSGKDKKPQLTDVKVIKTEPLFAKIDPEVIKQERAKIV